MAAPDTTAAEARQAEHDKRMRELREYSLAKPEAVRVLDTAQQILGRIDDINEFAGCTEAELRRALGMALIARCGGVAAARRALG